LLARELLDRPHTTVAEVVDVVDLAAVRPQIHDVADRVDDVVGVERLLGLGDVEVELPIDPEAADAAETILRLVEELLGEELLRLVELRRVARTEALVDPDQRILVALREILLEAVEDQRVLDLGDVADRAILAVDLALRLVIEKRLRDRLGDHLAARDDHRLAVLVEDVLRADFAGDLLEPLVARELDRFDRIEELEDRRVVRERLGHRPQEHRRRELSALVDAHRERVLLGDVELDPAPALRDDAAGMEALFARVKLLGEVDSRRSVELADDDALGAIDDEFAA